MFSQNETWVTETQLSDQFDIVNHTSEKAKFEVQISAQTDKFDISFSPKDGTVDKVRFNL